MPKIIRTAAAAAAMLLLFVTTAFAQELAAGGQAVGIQIDADGVMIAGLSEVKTAGGSCSPAAEAGLCEGDFITEIAGVKVEDAEDIVNALAASGGQETQVKVMRAGQELCISVRPALTEDGQYALGVWLRDGISGIGTLTFYDPESGKFGALGHSISLAEGSVGLPLESGSISEAEIVGIIRGKSGEPGALNGCAEPDKLLGSVELNTDTGVFGISCRALGADMYETGEMKAGRASILTTLRGRETAEYAIEINKVCRDGSGTHAVLTVTDPVLLAATGGIVQGMSGSPIIQDGKLVGAVTHVFISDPTKGYGIGIGDMLEAAGISAPAA